MVEFSSILLWMAGNYPRIPGITLGLCLVHYLLMMDTHRLALLYVGTGWHLFRRALPFYSSIHHHFPVPIRSHTEETAATHKTDGVRDHHGQP